MSKCGAHRGISVKVWCTQRDKCQSVVHTEGWDKCQSVVHTEGYVSVKVWCTQRDKCQSVVHTEG